MLDQILQSQSGTLEIDIYYNNALTDPTTCIITSIANPSGTVILTNQATVAGATTGRRSYTLALAYTATLGIYTAIWQFVISGTTYKHTQEFEVVSSLREGYCVPEEVRDYATYDQITASLPTDAVLNKYIKKASRLIDQYLGGSIEYGIYSEQVRCVLDKKSNGLHIQLNHKPIVSVTSVSVKTYESTVTTLTVSNMRINYNAGYLEWFHEGNTTTTYTICINDLAYSNIVPVASVVYTAGYTSIPEDVMLANVYLVEQLYRETNGDDTRLKQFKIGDYWETYDTDTGKKGRGVVGNDEVAELLKGYKQPARFFAGVLG